MPDTLTELQEEKYIRLFISPVQQCKAYKPKFGQGKSKDGVSLDSFHRLYGSDPFYAWIGLNSDLMYAAHKAAGGMTSIYRQIGIGCEQLFREIIKDTVGYTDPTLARWSYNTLTQGGKNKILTLDGRLEISQIQNQAVLDRLLPWMVAYCQKLAVEVPKNGIVFEVRQGYKSKDSKRQHADIDNATVAWAHGYMPIFAIFSSQIDKDLVLRYRNNRCGIMVGITSDDPDRSIFAFFNHVLGYDLAAFFDRNKNILRGQIEKVLMSLLSTDGSND